MNTASPYAADISEILSHRYDNGWDYWATPDKRLLKGAPFSTIDSASFLLELGVSPEDSVLQAVAQLLFDYTQQDGRIRLFPKGAIYPCQTALALNLLCSMGYAHDPRLANTFSYFLEAQEAGGGWKCNKYSYGRGPETAYANPLPTLQALHAFAQHDVLKNEAALENAIELLLMHWEIKKPIGPCHYGIGSLFMQVEYPFRGYNLFYYVYVLSMHEKARQDARFLEAKAALAEKLQDGKVVVERVVPKLAKLTFCKKGAPSLLATARYQEILERFQ